MRYYFCTTFVLQAIPYAGYQPYSERGTAGLYLREQCRMDLQLHSEWWNVRVITIQTPGQSMSRAKSCRRALPRGLPLSVLRQSRSKMKTRRPGLNGYLQNTKADKHRLPDLPILWNWTRDLLLYPTHAHKYLKLPSTQQCCHRPGTKSLWYTLPCQKD